MREIHADQEEGQRQARLLTFADLDEWPVDANDLTVRLLHWWSHTTWLLDDPEISPDLSH